MDAHHHLLLEPRENDWRLYRRAADGTGVDERLTTSARQQRPDAISPDGTRVVIEEQMPPAGFDFMLLTLDGTPRVEPLAANAVRRA